MDRLRPRVRAVRYVLLLVRLGVAGEQDGGDEMATLSVEDQKRMVLMLRK